jgi:hypothetical protein
MTNTRSKLINKIEKYLTSSGKSETAFGLAVINDGHLVRNIKAGRGISIDTADKITTFISENTIQQSINRKAS